MPALLALALAACKDEVPEDTGWAPELACPGSTGCEDNSGPCSPAPRR